MISLENAQEILLQQLTHLELDVKEIESVPLWEAGGRILAEEIVAKEDVPNFNRSPVDGFTFIAVDTVGATKARPVTLQIIDEVAAGSYSEKMVTEGTAMRIFTGAPLPKGANTIIKQEEVSENSSILSIEREVNDGENIALKGEDISSGESLLQIGTTIHSTHMGVLATLGMSVVSVFKKPRIGVFSTGCELVEVGEELAHGQLRVSNTYTLSEIIREAGGIPINLGIVKDVITDVTSIYDKAEQLNLPIVLSTGGTASGDYDLIKEAMDLVADTRLFNKVAMRPGAPVVASLKKKQMLIGLSGNPAGAAVAMYVLIYPLISKLAGVNKELAKSKAKLSSPLSRKGGLRGFLWASYEDKDGCLFVTPHDNQFCGALKTFSNSNCLVEVPKGKVDLAPGNFVTIWKLKR